MQRGHSQLEVEAWLIDDLHCGLGSRRVHGLDRHCHVARGLVERDDVDEERRWCGHLQG